MASGKAYGRRILVVREIPPGTFASVRGVIPGLDSRKYAVIIKPGPIYGERRQLNP